MNGETVFLFIGICGGAVFGLFLGSTLEANDWRDRAYVRGYAEYCRDTIEWAWLGECGK